MKVSSVNEYDAAIIGGGFFGAAIAIYLAKTRGLRRVVLLEREPAILSRASYHNQARVHNGYHYPRCFTTAYRSRVNLPRFLNDWPDVVSRDFTKVYAIARRNSKVSARQFLRFCRDIGAVTEPVDARTRALFDSQLIEEVFRVQEYAFDSRKLAMMLNEELAAYGVDVRVDTRVHGVWSASGKRSRLTTEYGYGVHDEIVSRYVFNCTYSGLNHFGGDFPRTRTSLKHEVAEMGLLRMPPALSRVGITVMDGPFFSMMPFPARGLHTLSHVRYTPHLQWNDEVGTDPFDVLRQYTRESRVDRMIRDASRYVPALLDAQHVDSLFEIKTILVKNESDDGRPILFEQHATHPGCYSILGSKIDNVYDVLERLDTEDFVVPQTRVAAGRAVCA